MYDLNQAPQAWYQRFTDYVTTLRFHHSSCDHSLFVYRHGRDIAYLLLYMHDIILTTSSPVLKQNLMSHLSHNFAMKDLGSSHYFLGISVTRNPRGLFLSQQTYDAYILLHANMKDYNPVTTPVDSAGKLRHSAGDLIDNPTNYRSLVGAL